MVKLGLIGAGHLGNIHLKLIKEIPNFELVGVYDLDAQAGEKAASNFACKHYLSAEELIHDVSALDIVSPTNSHYTYAKYALRKGKHVFVEKPVCENLDEAQDLVLLAEEAQVKTQVGHIERFNPAVLSVQHLQLTPLFVEAHRLASFNPRGTDVSVVLDLMIHDIDLVLSMVKANVKQVQANGVAIVSNTPDIANARIEFDNGCVANLTASRVSLKQMRKMRIFQKDAYVSLDLLEKKSEVVRLSNIPMPQNIPSFEINTGDDDDKKFIYIENTEQKDINALRKELEMFAESIIHNQATAVDFIEAHKALEVAHQVLSKIKKNSLATI